MKRNHSITLDYNDKDNDRMESLCREHGLDRSQLFRNALSVYEFLLSHSAAGAEIRVIHADRVIDVPLFPPKE